MRRPETRCLVAKVAGIACAIGVLLAPTAQALCDCEITLSKVVIRTNDDVNADGYEMVIDLEGTGVTSALVTPPGQSQIPLICDGGSCTISPDAIIGLNHFTTRAALNAAFPSGTGTYDFVIMGSSPCDGTTNISLAFNPTPPTCFPDITAPIHQETGVSTSPKIEWDDVSSCGNRIDVGIELPLDDSAIVAEAVLSNTATSWHPGNLASGTLHSATVDISNVTVTGFTGCTGEYLEAESESNSAEFTTDDGPPIPTLSQWGLIGLGLLLFIAMFLAIQRRGESA